MSTLSPISSSGLITQPGVDNSTRLEPNDIEQKKVRLRKATKQFESLFMYQMLKAMRKTVGENQLSKDAPFSDSFGKDTFMDMFDIHLAERMSGNHRSISELLYNSLVGALEPASENIDLGGEVQNLLNDNRNTIPLQRELLDFESDPVRFDIPVKVCPLRDSDRTNVSQNAAPDKIIAQYGRFIDKAATTNKIDSALICAVIKIESGGDPHAVSSAGAKGLMQLMDSTAAELGVDKVFDPHQNIECGTRYLRAQLDRFGYPRLALAAYNAGPENVERYKGIPPFPETEEYVSRVMDAFTSYQELMSANNAKAESH